MAYRGHVRRGRGPRGAEPEVVEALIAITARLEAIEMAQRRGVHIEDISEDEEERVVERGDKVNQPELDQGEERFIKAITRINSKP